MAHACVISAFTRDFCLIALGLSLQLCLKRDSHTGVFLFYRTPPVAASVLEGFFILMREVVASKYPKILQNLTPTSSR